MVERPHPPPLEFFEEARVEIGERGRGSCVAPLDPMDRPNLFGASPPAADPLEDLVDRESAGRLDRATRGEESSSP